MRRLGSGHWRLGTGGWVLDAGGWALEVWRSRLGIEAGCWRPGAGGQVLEARSQNLGAGGWTFRKIITGG